MGNKIEQLAIAHRIAMQDAASLLERYHVAIELANKTKSELEEAVDEEITRRRDERD